MFFTSPFWGILALLIFGSTFIVGYYYQRKARLYLDETLKNDSVEWNKRIKANAWRHLISRGIWGLFFVSFTYNIWNVSGQVVIFKLILFIVGILSIVWGIFGFRGEMKKLQDVK
jgi:hypothetical protein